MQKTFLTLKVGIHRGAIIELKENGDIMWQDVVIKDKRNRAMKRCYEEVKEDLERLGINNFNIDNLKFDHEIILADILDRHRDRKHIPMKILWDTYYINDIVETKRFIIRRVEKYCERCNTRELKEKFDR